MHHSREEISRILEVDYQHNHVGREYSCADVKKLMTAWIDQKGFLFCAPNAMFTGREVSKELFEFHSVNGGTGEDLTNGINLLLASLAPHYEKAVTYYDNPAVNRLARYATFPSTITRIDDGEDRTFAMEFNLRS